MRRSRRRTARRETNTELNITAFMNLMVVLIPFLLLTAVFSQVSILELDLPGSASETEQSLEEDETLQLEVIIQENAFVLSERKGGVVAEFTYTDNAEEALAELNSTLQVIKARNMELTAMTILAQPDTSYDLIIQAMDAVRLIPPSENTDNLPGELFPDISLGSAPVTEDAGA